MKRIIVLAIFVATATLFAGYAADASAAGRGPEHRGHPDLWLLKKLDLSPVQKQQAKDIFRTQRSQIKPVIQQMAAERRALRNLVQADAIDEQAIRTQAARVAAVQADLAVQRAHLFHDLRGILTPEQLQKFKELQAKMDQRIDEHLSGDAKL
jgi:periplasmic protein CpxP/Spy